MFATIAEMLGVRQIFVKLGFGLLTLLALGFAIWCVVVWYDAQLDAAFDSGEKSAYAKVEKRAIQIADKLNASAVKLKEKADEASSIVASSADDLRVHGPGRASCPGVAIPISRGHVSPAAPASVAVAPMPGEERPQLAAVPFPQLVTVFEEHDQCIIEAQAWRDDKVARDALIAQESK